MAIQKKSLINTLKTTKKANVASSEVNAKPTSVTSKRSEMLNARKSQTISARAARAEFKSLRRR